MRKRAAQVALLLVAILVSSLAGFVHPAWACGCGAMVANDQIRVDGESSIVRWATPNRS